MELISITHHFFDELWILIPSAITELMGDENDDASKI